MSSETQFFTVPDALRLGMKHHQAGSLQHAELIYRKVLDAEPNNAEALHLLGLVYFQSRNHERALGLIQRAIGINPAVPAFYSNLGLIFQELGHFDIAIINFQKAISLNKDYAEAHNNLGTVLYTIQRHTDALACYERALAIRPNYAEAHYNSGIVLKALGKTDEAIAAYKRAIELRSNYAEAHNNLGFIYQEQEKHDEAYEHYQKAIALRPDYAEAHNNIGAVYLAQGKLDEAIASYNRAIELRPGYAEAYNNLGYALAEQKRHDEAVVQYEKALSLKPDYTDAYNNLGLSLRERGEFEAALKAYQRALELQPDFGKAHNNMGTLFQQLGRFDEAISSYMRSIVLKNNYAPAYRNLVHCRKFTEQDLPVLKELETYLESADLDKNDESDIHFALGKIHDDLGQYEQAFSHYKKANDLEHQKYTFDREQHSEMINDMIGTFSSSFFETRKTMGSDSVLPIFILGMMRSGTTLVEQILSSHPDVFGGGELDFWADQAKKYPIETVTELNLESVQGMASDCLAYLKKFSADALHVTDKMPNNYLKIGWIHLAFPKAKIIHCKRNPADICLSIYSHKFGGYHPYGYDLDDLAFYYEEYERLMEHWRAVLPSDVFLEVQYEELVADQEKVSRTLLEFCGLGWVEQCLDFFHKDRPVKTASCWQVRQPLYKTSVERWRKFEPFLGPLSRLIKK